MPKLLEFKAFGDSLVSTAFVDDVNVPQVAQARASTSAASADTDTLPRQKVTNKDFGYALIDSFQKGFKARRNKPAELIAKYIDKAMRKGQKGRDDRDYSSELDAALGLYRFTDDKDVFRAFYHRALARRLLLEKSASDDHEKAMLKKLKEREYPMMLIRSVALTPYGFLRVEYDPDFGMGDQMFTDLALSRELMKEYTEPRGDRAVDTSTHLLTAMVLQRSFWPFTARKQDVALPEWVRSVRCFQLTCTNIMFRWEKSYKVLWTFTRRNILVTSSIGIIALVLLRSELGSKPGIRSFPSVCTRRSSCSSSTKKSKSRFRRSNF